MTNNSAPMPSIVEARGQLGSQTKEGDRLMGRMTPSAREERRKEGGQEEAGTVSSSVTDGASAGRSLVAQALQLTENSGEVRSPVTRPCLCL